MEITGKFIQSYYQEWRKTCFTILTMDDISRMVGFTAIGSDNVDAVGMLNSGDIVSVEFYPESYQFDNKIHTELYMVKVMVTKPLEGSDGID